MEPTKQKSLQTLVDEALDAAEFESEYVELMSYSVEELTDDLMMYVSTLEGASKDEVMALVKEYQHWYANREA